MCKESRVGCLRSLVGAGKVEKNESRCFQALLLVSHRSQLRAYHSRYHSSRTRLCRSQQLRLMPHSVRQAVAAGISLLACCYAGISFCTAKHRVILPKSTRTQVRVHQGEEYEYQQMLLVVPAGRVRTKNATLLQGTSATSFSYEGEEFRINGAGTRIWMAIAWFVDKDQVYLHSGIILEGPSTGNHHFTARGTSFNVCLMHRFPKSVEFQEVRSIEEACHVLQGVY